MLSENVNTDVSYLTSVQIKEFKIHANLHYQKTLEPPS